jgi:hypothetical protein
MKPIVYILCAAASMLVHPSSYAQFPTTGLAAYYQFDGDVADLSGNNNNGTAVGSPNYSATSRPTTRGLRFDNPSWNGTVTQYVSFPNSSTLQSLDNASFTIALCYQTTDNAQQNGRLLGTSSGGKQITFNYNAQTDAQPYAGVSDGTNSIGVGAGKGNAVTDGLSHWQILVLDRQQNQLRMFVDGSLIETVSYTTLGTLTFENFVVGCTSPNSPQNEFGARATIVDELRVYNRPLVTTEIRSPDIIEAAGQYSGIPARFYLLPNFPNPFNPSTTIAFELPEAAHVSLKVYTALGEEVATLMDADTEAGRHEIRWNASGAASGVYLYTIRAGRYIETRRMVLLK